MTEYNPISIITDDLEHIPTWLTNTKIGRWLYRFDDMKTHRQRVIVFAKLNAGLVVGALLIKMGVF